MAIVWQVIIGLVTAVTLDGGNAFRIFLIACAAFWCCAISSSLRRSKTPTLTDQIFLRWGFPPLFVVTYIVVYVAWHARGLL